MINPVAHFPNNCLAIQKFWMIIEALKFLFPSRCPSRITRSSTTTFYDETAFNILRILIKLVTLVLLPILVP